MHRALFAAALAAFLFPAVIHAQDQAEPSAETVVAPADTLTGDWNTTATGRGLPVGARYAFVCPPQGARARIWGTGVYTDDSSICTAAVHAGLIGFEKGGVVVVEMMPGQKSYRASVQNEVGSEHWDEWGASFRFVTKDEETVPAEESTNR